MRTSSLLLATLVALVALTSATIPARRKLLESARPGGLPHGTDRHAIVEHRPQQRALAEGSTPELIKTNSESPDPGSAAALGRTSGVGGLSSSEGDGGSRSSQGSPAPGSSASPSSPTSSPPTSSSSSSLSPEDIWPFAMCTSPTGEVLECPTAEGSVLAEACSLGSGSFPGQALFSDKYVFPYTDCSSHPDLHITEYASAMADANDLQSCACKCEAYLYCSSWTFYPDSISDALPINCLLFAVPPANITLCQTSAGATSGMLLL